MAIATTLDVMVVAPGEMISEGLTTSAERNGWPVISGAAIKTLLRRVVTESPRVVVMQLSNALLEQTLSMIESLRVLRPGIRIVAAAVRHHELIEQASRCAGVAMYLPNAADDARIEATIASLTAAPTIEPGITTLEPVNTKRRLTAAPRMSISRLGMAGMVFFAFALSLMAGGTKAQAAPVILQDRESAAYFNFDGTATTPGLNQPSVAAPFGLYDLQRPQVITGQAVSPPLHDVNQQWFWYRVGSGAEHPLNNLTFDYATVYDTNPSIDSRPDHLEVQYHASNFIVQIQYDLLGGTQYSHTTGLTRSIAIINTGATNLAFHFFDYSDLTLGYAYWNTEENGTHPDLGQVVNSDGSAIRQWDNDGDFVSPNYLPGARRDSDSLTTSLTAPSRWGMSLNTGSSSILTSLNNGSATTLSDNLTTNGGLPGNLAFAFQYDFVLGPGEGWIGGANLLIVPEPASFALICGTGLLLTMRRPQRNRLRYQANRQTGPSLGPDPADRSPQVRFATA